MAVDFKTFLQVVPHVTAVKKPVLIRGRHGVGKSEVIYQFMNSEIKAESDLSIFKQIIPIDPNWN